MPVLCSARYVLSVDAAADRRSRTPADPLEGQGGGAVFRVLTEKLGQNIRLRIRRGREERELERMVGSVEVITYRIAEGGSPTSEQLRVREAWLKR